MKNTLVVLVVLTLAFGGYYLYNQNKNAAESPEGVVLTEDILLSTQVFIERRAILDRVRLDTSLFEDEVFRSYRSFREPVPEEAYGRNNPFGDVVRGEQFINF